MGLFCLASATALALGGCGDDEASLGQDTARTPETSPATTTRAPTPPEREETVTVPPDDAAGAPGPKDGPRAPSPEEGPGGAGDEQPASSQALFTGRAGSVRPRLVQVPPFIAIRVELRSADGRAYRLSFRGRSLAVSGARRAASSTFDGLRPGRRMVGTGTAEVVVEASAEPGP